MSDLGTRVSGSRMQATTVAAIRPASSQYTKSAECPTRPRPPSTAAAMKLMLPHSRTRPYSSFRSRTVAATRVSPSGMTGAQPIMNRPVTAKIGQKLWVRA